MFSVILKLKQNRAYLKRLRASNAQDLIDTKRLKKFWNSPVQEI